MSPNPNPGANITGQDADFEAYVRGEVARVHAESMAAAGTPTTPTPEPITVNLNGQQFSFNNQADLNSALQNTFGQYNLEMERLKATNAAAPPAPRGTEVTGQDDPFDVKIFVDKMTSDPVAAFDYVDGFRYGKDATKNIKGAIASTSDVSEMKQALAVYRFRDAHPEFTPQYAPVMQQIIQSRGLPSDYNGLEAAYALGLTSGMIRPPAPQQNQQDLQMSQYGQPQHQQGQPQWNNAPAPPQYNQNPYGAPQPQFQNPQYAQNPNFAPPRPNRSSPIPTEDFGSMAENMTTEQIQTIMARYQN